MIDNYQQRRQVEENPTFPINLLGVVTGVYADGLTVLLEGESIPSSKRYKRNLAVTFTVGQRVKLCSINGGLIVEYPFG